MHTHARTRAHRNCQQRARAHCHLQEAARPSAQSTCMHARCMYQHRARTRCPSQEAAWLPGELEANLALGIVYEELQDVPAAIACHERRLELATDCGAQVGRAGGRWWHVHAGPHSRPWAPQPPNLLPLSCAHTQKLLPHTYSWSSPSQLNPTLLGAPLPNFHSQPVCRASHSASPPLHAAHARRTW